MSDSDDSLPTLTRIEDALRTAVRRAADNGLLESLTLAQVRKTVTEELQLPVDYLKGGSWSKKCKDIVGEEVDVVAADYTLGVGAKRKASSDQKPSQRLPKRRKTVPSSPLEPEERKGSKRSEEDLSDASDLKVTEPKKKKKEPKTIKDDPAQNEMKKLQSQLVKCGVRKAWGIELSRFDTVKEKITHLRGMLNDIGMTGRFSEEKASQIKERRELAADLEEITERNKQWGQAADVSRRKSTLPMLDDLASDEESDD